MTDHESQRERVVAGRYEVRKSLGRGGFSEVWLAYDRQLEREVALKQLFGSVEDDAFRKQREREIKIHSKLRSKYVMPLYDAFIHDGSQYLVLELMDFSLSRFVDKVSIDRVLQWMKDCLLGLTDIHAHGVIHRDIKPGNIFLDHQGSIRIGDFGVAQTGQSASLPALSPKFIAPEIIVGDSSKVGPSSDLYSLGLVLYQLILGDEGAKEAFPEVYEGVDRPEALNNRWLLWHNNLDRPAPALSSLRSEIPKDVSDWVLRMVDKDPTMRFQSAKEALSSLPGGDGHIPEPASHTKEDLIGQRTTKEPRIMSMPAWLNPVTLLAIVVVVSAGMYFLWPDREPQTAILTLEPAESAELVVQWNGSELQPGSSNSYLLREPATGGELIIRKDTFEVLDTSLTMATGDSVTLTISPHLARIDSLIQLSNLSMLTFILNVESTVKVEGLGSKTGKRVEYTIEPGEYIYSVTSKGFSPESGQVRLRGAQSEFIEIVLVKSKMERRSGFVSIFDVEPFMYGAHLKHVSATSITIAGATRTRDAIDDEPDTLQWTSYTFTMSGSLTSTTNIGVIPGRFYLSGWKRAPLIQNWDRSYFAVWANMFAFVGDQGEPPNHLMFNDSVVVASIGRDLRLKWSTRIPINLHVTWDNFAIAALGDDGDAMIFATAIRKDPLDDIAVTPIVAGLHLNQHGVKSFDTVFSQRDFFLAGGIVNSNQDNWIICGLHKESQDSRPYLKIQAVNDQFRSLWSLDKIHAFPYTTQRLASKMISNPVGQTFITVSTYDGPVFSCLVSHSGAILWAHTQTEAVAGSEIDAARCGDDGFAVSYFSPATPFDISFHEVIRYGPSGQIKYAIRLPYKYKNTLLQIGSLDWIEPNRLLLIGSLIEYADDTRKVKVAERLWVGVLEDRFHESKSLRIGATE